MAISMTNGAESGVTPTGTPNVYSKVFTGTHKKLETLPSHRQNRRITAMLHWTQRCFLRAHKDTPVVWKPPVLAVYDDPSMSAQLCCVSIQWLPYANDMATPATFFADGKPANIYIP